MGLTIDWGTMVISVPVIAASCFGAVKFFGEAYFKEHLDRRAKEIEKEFEAFKSKLETDQVEYIKRLDIQIERNRHIIDTYTPKYIAATENVRNEMNTCFQFLKTANYEIPSECHTKENELKTIFELNQVYISPKFKEHMIAFIGLFNKVYNNHIQMIRSTDNAMTIYADWEKNSKELKNVHDDIETLVQMELSGKI
ncbi:hypothetical protein [Paenibacillus sp. FSL H3-0286]|uniref:hypothetical protein n=1 Tax=Paenibacillus sp. FSL H3-0286 TaxID=2921427 RepID=UPI0032451063